MSSSNLDIYKFPFDTQVCYVTFGNIADSDIIVTATNLTDKVDFSLFIKNQNSGMHVFIGY